MTEPIVLKRPIARIDLAVCYGHLGERNPATAHRFRLNAEATFSKLASNPGLGEPYRVSDRRLAGLRCSRIKRFKNHLVFYLPLENGIEVIRVLHGARNIRSALKEDV